VSGTGYYVYDYYGTGYGTYGQVPSGYHFATKVLLNDGKGVFRDVSNEWLPEIVDGDLFVAEGIRLGDLDADGSPEVLLATTYNPTTYYYYYYYGTVNRPLRVFDILR